MKVLFAGGGTAGHINPALAIAGYIKSKEDAQILFVGAKGKMEEKIVKDAGYNFEGIDIKGFNRKISPSGIKDNFVMVNKLVRSLARSHKILKNFKPDICVGTGGYVSGPVLWQASYERIPILIHEQNAYPGKTTKMLCPRAKCVMLASPGAKKRINPKCNVKVVGNPLRGEILTLTQQQAKKKLGLDDRPVVLSFGGSLGAEKVNRAVVELLVDSAKKNNVQHIHGYSKNGTWFLFVLHEKGIDVKDYPNFIIQNYIEDMPTCLKAADLVICRAGAMTLSEISAAGKPSILIPSPNVTENHQYHNAMEFASAKASVLIKDEELTGQKLTAEVKKLLQDKELLNQYAQNAKKLAILGAEKNIYSIIKSYI